MHGTRFAVASATSFDVDRLRKCFQAAAERQRSLVETGRGVDFVQINLNSVQQASYSNQEWHTEIQGLTEIVRQVQVDVAKELEDPCLARGEQGPLAATAASIVIRLVRYAAGKDLLVILADRMLIDPTSLCLFLADVKLLYESSVDIALPPLEMQFDEYKVWQEHRQNLGDAAALQMAFWQNVLASPPPVLELPTDFNSLDEVSIPSTRTKRKHGLLPVSISDHLSDRLRQFSIDQSLQMRIVLLAAYHLLLARHSGTTDVAVGCHVSERESHVELKKLVGNFENWVPVRVRSDDHPSIKTFVGRVAESHAAAEANPSIKLSDLKRTVGNGGRLFSAGFEVYGNTVDELSFPLITTRLIRIVLGLESLPAMERVSHDSADVRPIYGDPDAAQPEGAILSTDTSLTSSAIKPKSLTIGGIEMFPVPLPPLEDSTSDDDLRLLGVSSPITRLALQYDLAKFSASTIERFAEHLIVILDSILDGYANDDMHVSHFPVMRFDEEELVLEKFNQNTAALDPKTASLGIHQLVERQAKLTPDACAVHVAGHPKFASQSLSYRDLDQRANQLANFLILLGAEEEELIPVLLHRGALLVIAWLAVLKAGSSIMPLDPKFPDERVQLMAQEARARIILTEEALENRFLKPATEGPSMLPQPKTLALDREWDRTVKFGSTGPPKLASFTSERLAYTIFTSGSTGRPKGVMLEHRAIINYVHWHIEYYKMTPRDRVFATAGLAFDASLADTWPTLSVGACLLPICDSDISVVPPRFFDWVAKEKVTMGFLTTQICEMVLEEDLTFPRDDISHLRLIYTGGDRLHFSQRRDAPFELVNIYGPTENTINSSMAYIPRGLRSPPLIGAPAPNTQCLVLNGATMQPVPIGVFGELFVSGAQLARGYFDMPELTAQTFIPNPFVGRVGTDRLYRTGDLVRWVESGQLEFLGRKDTQVKIRGNRVELTAIESELLADTKVKDCVAVAREDVPGQKLLVAYVVAKAKVGDLDSQALADSLRNRLPGFMVPSLFVQLDALPLTPNHKVDRKALPRPGQGAKARQGGQDQMKKLNGKAELVGQAVQDSSILPLLAKVRSVFASVLGTDRNSRGIRKIDEGEVSNTHGRETPMAEVDELDFFEAGGDSLSAGRATTHISRIVGIKLPVSLLYKFPNAISYCQAVVIEQSANYTNAQVPDDLNSSGLSAAIGKSAHKSALGGSGEMPVSHDAAMPSFNEESLWLVAQRSDTFASQAYNVPFSFCIQDQSAFLEPEKLKVALIKLVRNTEALRTVYRESRPMNSAEGDLLFDPVQGSDDEFRLIERHVFEGPAADAVDYQTVRFAPPLHGDTRDNSSTVMKDFLARESYAPFDLANGPLIRARLVFAFDKQYFLLVVHHIVIDLWSLVLVLDRLFAYYFESDCFEGKVSSDKDFAPGKSLIKNLGPDAHTDSSALEENSGYRRFIRQQRAFVRTAQAASMLDFWKKHFAGLDPRLELPYDFQRPARKTFRGGSSLFRLGTETSAALVAIARNAGVTLNVTLLAIFGVLLRRYTLANKVHIGVPTSGRSSEEVESMIGYFVNPVVIQADMAGDPTLAQLLARVSDSVLAGLDNAELPFPHIVAQLSAARSDSQSRVSSADGSNPLFNVCFVLQRPFLGRKGLAECMLGFDEEALELHPALDGKVRSFVTPHQHAQFDLCLMVSLDAQGLIAGSLQYSSDLFSCETAEAMAKHYVNLATSAASSAVDSVNVSQLAMISEAERELVMETFNETDSEYQINEMPPHEVRSESLSPGGNAAPIAETFLVGKATSPHASTLFSHDQDVCIHHLVEDQAACTPDAPSMEWIDSSTGARQILSYGQLDSRANRLANFLRFAGVGLEDLVPVQLERGPDLLIAWLAVLKAGGAIMPMDPKFPPERIRLMLADADAGVAITERKLKIKFPDSFVGRIILVDEDNAAISLASSRAAPRVQHQPSSLEPSCLKQKTCLAYVIYTSGTTAAPKGVMLEHSAVVSYVKWHVRFYKMTAADRVFATAGLAFDASMADTWPTLAVGACILPIIEPEESIIPHRFFDFIAKSGSTMGFLTTQICEMMLEEDANLAAAQSKQATTTDRQRGPVETRETSRPTGLAKGGRLRLIYTGGDRLHFSQRADAPFELVNIYGPTENTINSSMAYLPKGQKKPPLIGKPAPNTQCFVLDPELLLPVPIGVFGELFVGGAQLARGYFRRTDLTSEKFIANPGFSACTSRFLYKTGDLVRWTRDGQLEFLGRRDLQVKIRGNRIELAAVESSVLEEEGVREVAAIAQSDPTSGDKVLVAYIIVDNDQRRQFALDASSIDTWKSTLRQSLKQRLPGFMVPSIIYLMEEFPLTPNHKIDRRALAPQCALSKSPSNSQNEVQNSKNKSRLRQAVSASSGSTSTRTDGHFALKTRVHQKVVEMFARALGYTANDVSDEDDFFEIGGHSLSAARIMSSVRKVFAIDMPLSKFLLNPTVLGVMNFVERTMMKRDNLVFAEPEKNEHQSVRDVSFSSKLATNLPSSEATVISEGAASNSIKFANNSLLSSSYRDSVLTNWLKDNRDVIERSRGVRTMGNKRNSSTLSSFQSAGTPPHSSQYVGSLLRQTRLAKGADIDENIASTPDEGRFSVRQSLPPSKIGFRNSARVSDKSQTMAHSPMWIESSPALKNSLEQRHASTQPGSLDKIDNRRKGIVGAKRQVTPKVSVLSYNQQSLWFLHKMSPSRVDYVVHVCCELDQSHELDVDCFQIALQSLVNMHGSLRTVYGEEAGAPYQIVFPPLEACAEDPGRLIVHSSEAAHATEKPPLDTSLNAGLGSTASEPNRVDFAYNSNRYSSHALLIEELEKVLHSPWELHLHNSFRARLYMSHEGKHVLLLTAHHIAMDGWSLDIILDDLGRFYDKALAHARARRISQEHGQSNLDEHTDRGCMAGLSSTHEAAKAMDMAQFSVLQKEELSSAAGGRLWSFWQQQLAGHDSSLDLPTDFPRRRIEDEPSQNGAWFHFSIDGEELVMLQAAIKLERATLFMALLALYSALLYRYTGKEDILIGTPMACRTLPELDRTVGNITNMVVLRMQVGPRDNFRSLLRQARAVVLSAFEHQEFPFSVLVERMSSFRQSRQSPLFQVMLSLNQVFGVSSSPVGNASGVSAPSLARLEIGEPVRLGSSGLKVRAFHGQGCGAKVGGLEQRTSPYDLQLIVTQGASGPQSGALRAAFQYKSSVFSTETIECMAEHLTTLVHQSAVDHSRLYCTMPILSAAEKRLMLGEWNATASSFSTEICAHQLFEAQVAKHPFAIAVGCDIGQWTYHELNRRANILARYLRLKGIEPSARVGILLPRSPSMVLAMIAVAKSGGCYIPMDVAWPSDRLVYVLQDSGLSAILCNKDSAHLIKSSLESMHAAILHDSRDSSSTEKNSSSTRKPLIIPMNRKWARIEQRVLSRFVVEEAEENLPPPASSSWGRTDQQWHGSRSMLYLVYTSGSTGKPKGVVVEHRSLVNLIAWYQQSYKLTPKDRVSQLVGAAFDPVGLEIWPPLASGASIHIVHDSLRSDLGRLTNWLHNQRISVSLLPTPLLEVFLKSRSNQAGGWPSSLRVVYGGGDKLHVPASIVPTLPFRLDNHYGPSEGTIMCTFSTVNTCPELEAALAQNEVLAPCIGRPMANFALFVLDEQLLPVPALVAGELWIAGPGLAQGYHGRHELTRERFVEIPEHLMQSLHGFLKDPSSFGSRMYKTGDRVRYQRNGNVEFIGRVDFQVKIRGMRVELGEIESVIKQEPAILECCVLVREDKPGQQRLCAYVALQSCADGKVEFSQVERTHQLQNLVKDKLPAYMVPSEWLFLSSLPLTANGKVDRKALPAPLDHVSDESKNAKSVLIPPRTTEEMIVADLWKQVLGLETVSIYDNFWDLGGHSLAATQLLSLVRDTFRIDVSIATFFDDSSIEGLATAIVAQISSDGTNELCRGDDGTELLSVGNGRPVGEPHNTRANERVNTSDQRSSSRSALGFDPLQETILDEDIGPFESKPGERDCADEFDVEPWSCAFLTGGTGFLGTFLIHEMFQRAPRSRTVVCLVRGKSDAACLHRLVTSLEKFELFDKGTIPTPQLLVDQDVDLDSARLNNSEPRLLVVRGDLSQPLLGMDERLFDRCAQMCQLILHSGAYVHSLFPYSRLRAANVGGTKEALRLAFHRSKTRGYQPAAFVHISTLSVFAPPPNTRTDQIITFSEQGPIAHVESLCNLEGYAQTKWVGEFLVREANKRGCATAIIRPGRITGHSQTGVASYGDFMALFLKGCIQLQKVPALKGWVMDMNPVDYVCESILKVAQDLEACNGLAFNICHPDPIYLPEYFQWVRDFGYECPMVSYPEWRSALVRVANEYTMSLGAKSRRERQDRPGSGSKSDDTTASSVARSIAITPGVAFREKFAGAKNIHVASPHALSSDSRIDEKEGMLDNSSENALYPVLPMFGPDAASMDPGVRVKFICSQVLGQPYPPYPVLQQVYFQRMISDGFIPPPAEDKEFFSFD